MGNANALHDGFAAPAHVDHDARARQRTFPRTAYMLASLEQLPTSSICIHPNNHFSCLQVLSVSMLLAETFCQWCVVSAGDRACFFPDMRVSFLFLFACPHC